MAATRGWRKEMAWAAGLLLAAGLLAGWLRPADRAATPTAAGVAGSAAADTAALLERAAASFAAPPAVTLRFCSVDLGAAAAARAAGEAAAQRLGLRAAPAAASGDAAYRAEGTAAGGARVTLLLAGSSDGASSFMIVKLEAQGPIEREALLDWQRDAERRLASLGVRGAWNAMLQGPLASKAAPGGGTAVSPEAALAAAAQPFRAQAREAYEDSGTYSVSYETKSLAQTIRSGRHDIGLQAALHRDSQSGAWRLTLGAPLITTEY